MRTTVLSHIPRLPPADSGLYFSPCSRGQGNLFVTHHWRDIMTKKAADALIRDARRRAASALVREDARKKKVLAWARYFHQQGDYSEACACYYAVGKHPPTESLLMRAGEKGAMDTKLRATDAKSKESCDFTKIGFWIGMQCAGFGMLDVAIKFFRRAKQWPTARQWRQLGKKFSVVKDEEARDYEQRARYCFNAALRLEAKTPSQ